MEDDIEKFTVPRSSHDVILNSLSGASKADNPMTWEVLGDIEITHDSGLLEVSLFQTGEEIGAFRVDGKYYRGGSDAEFILLIEAAHLMGDAEG